MEIYRSVETIKSIFYVHCIIQSSIIKKTVCMQRNCFISYVTYQKGAFKDAIVSAELEPAIMTYPFYLISVFYSLYVCLNVGIGRFTCAFENQIATTHYNCACFLRANCRLPLLSTVYCPFEYRGYLYLILNISNLKVIRIIMIMVNVFYELRGQLLLGYDNRQ